MHVAFAALALFGLAMATATKDLLAIPLVVMWVLRLRYTRWCYPRLLRDWVFLGVVGWIVLLAASTAWSSDPSMGFEQVRAFRFLIVVLMAWPVMHRPGPLIAGFVAGASVNLVVQGLQWLELLGFAPGMNQRLYGLMHPIRTAMILSAACLWCLSAASTVPAARRGWIVGLLAAAIATAGGVAMTGSRGPWIALAGGLAALLLVLLVRVAASRRRALIATGALMVAGLALSPLAADFVGSRLAQARADLAAADEGTYDTDVGFRLASYRTAMTLIREHPFRGHGAGAFWDQAPRVRPDMSWEGITHAHSTWLTAGVETGLPSVALIAVLLGASATRAWRRAAEHPAMPGTFAVIVAWALSAFTDTPHHSGTMNGLLEFALILTISTGWSAAAGHAVPDAADDGTASA
jgi:O-antigen ligase